MEENKKRKIPQQRNEGKPELIFEILIAILYFFIMMY